MNYSEQPEFQCVCDSPLNCHCHLGTRISTNERNKFEEHDKQEAINKLIASITFTKDILNKEVEKARKKEELTLQLIEACKNLNYEAEKKLEEARPAMLKAKEATYILQKSDIPELKSLGKPTQPIQDVTKAVLLLRGDHSDFTWQKALKMLGNPIKFLAELREYNYEEINKWILKKLKPILSQPYFNPEYMKSQNFASSFICAWVVNVVEYDTKYKQIKPLILEKEAVEIKLGKKKEEIALIQAKIKETEDTLEILESELRSAVSIS